MFKFIHAADIHLDSPMLNLDQYDGAPSGDLRVATREAFDNLIQIAIEQEVDFLLIAGDLYDKDSPDFNSPRHVLEKFGELDEQKIRVFIIQGNHDAESQTRKSFGALKFPKNVHVFSTRKPETVSLDEIDVAIHGQGFATRAVEEDLSSKYPAPVAGQFNIGVLHTNVGGLQTHDNYAPSNLENLRSHGYEYWALGHIHKRNELSGGMYQQIRYAGNTQGRHIGESGPKGCLLVTVDDSRRISVKFHATDVWRWWECMVDASNCTSAEEVLVDSIRSIQNALNEADGRSLAVRVRVTGASQANHDLRGHAEYWRDKLCRMCVDEFDEQVWLEKLKITTRSPVATDLEDREEVNGELVGAIRDATVSPDLIEDLRRDLKKMLDLVPKDPRLQGLFDLDDEDEVAVMIDDAKQLLVSRMLHPHDAAGKSEDDA